MIYDVTDYGADPEGIRECAAEIQAAIDDCAEDGAGTVYAPAGTYRIGTSLSQPSDVAITGDGRHVTYIRGTGGIDGPLLIQQGNGAEKTMRARVADLTLHGNRTASAGIDWTRVQDATIERVAILRCLDAGIRLGDYCTGSMLTMVSAMSMPYGIDMDGVGTTENMTIACNLGHSTMAGVRIKRGNHNLVYRATLDGCYRGVVVESDIANGAKFNEIVQCRLEGCVDHDVWIDSENVTATVVSGGYYDGLPKIHNAGKYTDVRVRGAQSIPEWPWGTPPPLPPADLGALLYTRNGRLIVAYVDGDVTRYKSLPLAGDSVTWEHSTEAP